MQLTKTIYAIFISVILLYGCTEVIDIDLNSSEPQVVIEAIVSTNGNTYVKLSESVNFDDNNEYPPVSGALVEISDNSGNTELLIEENPGIYNCTLSGKSGDVYHLKITHNSDVFTSTCEIPKLVTIDSISISKEYENGFFGPDTVTQVRVYYNDPAGEDNYYHFVERLNGKQVKSYVMSDKETDGQNVAKLLNYPEREVQSGDMVSIEMRSVTKEVYHYFKDLHSNDFLTTTPTNPRTNINNAKLGYFSAHASDIMAVEFE